VLDFLTEHIPSLQLEVPTSDGRVDALSPRAVIEVVRLSSWKTGLGQLCADRRHFPQLAPVLWIYGDDLRPPPRYRSSTQDVLASRNSRRLHPVRGSAAQRAFTRRCDQQISWIVLATAGSAVN